MLRLLLALALAIVPYTVALAQPPDQAQPKVLQYAINSYNSPNLRASFLAQEMTLPGFPTFWGARITAIEPGSPLQQLPGIQVGDVITRLDGIRISNGMYEHWGQSHYDLPQLELHFGQTKVRWIRTGTQNVRINTIQLGGGGPGPGTGPGPIAP